MGRLPLKGNLFISHDRFDVKTFLTEGTLGGRYYFDQSCGMFLCPELHFYTDREVSSSHPNLQLISRDELLQEFIDQPELSMLAHKLIEKAEIIARKYGQTA